MIPAAILVATAPAQIPLSAKEQADSAALFTKELKEERLDCDLETRKPFLDYAFRYQIGYVVRCGLAQFEGNETSLGMLLRITPLHRDPVILGQPFTAPGIPDTLRGRVNLKELRAEIQLSGVYAAGAGSYENEVVVLDSANRTFRKKWRVRTPGSSLGEVPRMALKPLQVESISLPPWTGVSGDGTGLHFTVLLDAAPGSQYSARLRPWDRAFLLGALSSVLREFPLASVRLIAFNLDQQRELFREESFDASSMPRLAETLAGVELGRISYATLQRGRGWAELLSRLLRQERERDRPSDAIVFVGPAQRYRTASEVQEISSFEMPSPLFYFQYSPRPGSEFPDAIERITTGARGSIFRLHSPEDLAQALNKMRDVLKIAAVSPGAAGRKTAAD